MLQFLPALMKGMQGAGQQTGGAAPSVSDRFFQALGASGQGKSNSNFGMQFANSGGIPQVSAPDALSKVIGMQQQQPQRQQIPTTQLNPLLAMLMQGGR